MAKLVQISVTTCKTQVGKIVGTIAPRVSEFEFSFSENTGKGFCTFQADDQAVNEIRHRLDKSDIKFRVEIF